MRLSYKISFQKKTWCKIKINDNRELLDGVCYRTPSENVYDHGIHENITELVREISSKNFMLFGDFNYRGIDWTCNCCDGTESVYSRLSLDCVC